MSRVRLVHVILPTLAAVLVVTTAFQDQGQPQAKGKKVTAEQLGLEVVESSTSKIAPGTEKVFRVKCPDGKVAISGGFCGSVPASTPEVGGVYARISIPDNIGDGWAPLKWMVVVVNEGTVKAAVKAYALCINKS